MRHQVKNPGNPALRYYLCMAAVTTLPLISIWGVEYLPLVDYPNHLSRAYILWHYDEVPAFQEWFGLTPRLMPNMALDLLVSPLLRFLDPLTAGRVFLTLAALLFSLGCDQLGRTVNDGKPNWLALPAALGFYNSTLYYGFVNYCFGVSVYLIALAFWMRSAGRWNAPRLLAATALAGCAYLAHLTAIAFLALSAFILAVLTREWRAFLGNLLPLTPAAFVYLALGPYRGDVGRIEWGGLQTKAIAALGWLLTYDYALDAAFAVLLAAGVALLLRSAAVRLEKRLAVLAGSLWVLFVLTPDMFHTAGAAAARFVPPAVVLSVLALRIEPRSRRLAAGLLSLLLVAMLARLALVGLAWRESSELTQTQVRLFDSVPRGSRLYPLVRFAAEPRQAKRERGLLHAASYAVIRRHAWTPTTFAQIGQHSILHREQVVYIDPSPGDPLELDWGPIFAHGGYVWTYRADETLARHLDACCRLAGAEGAGRLYALPEHSEGRASSSP